MAQDTMVLVTDLAGSVGRLRASLEDPLLTDLERVLAQAQASLEAVNGWAGGPDGLRQALDALPATEKERAEQMLRQARVDQSVNAELLSLAMKRNAALQAEMVQSSDAATYSSEGGFQMGASNRLLGKF